MKSSFRTAAIRSVATAALLAGLGALAASPAWAVTRGGTLSYGRYADSLFLDPVLNDANVDIWILSNLYDTLLLPTDDGKGVKPGLATAWKVADDGKSVTLTLREGTRFSDGSPITAEDVKFSLTRAINPKNGIWQFLVDSVASVDVKDPKTVVLTLKHPDPAILPALSTFNTSIMPQKAFEASPGATDADKARAFAEHPVGSGPFVLKSWSHGSDIKLVKNPYYWDKGEDGQPLPYLDGVDFPVIPDDATRILKVQSGELDASEFIPFSRVEELKGDSNLNMALFPSTKVSYGTFNVAPKLPDGTDNPLSNEKVRQALNYATDKEAIIQIVTHGVGTQQTSYMSAATPYHTGTTPLFPTDMDKAKQLLTDAGFGGGFSFACIVVAGNVDELSTATALQQMWQPLGVNLRIDQQDNATMQANYHKGAFSLRMGSWTDDIADPNEITSYFAYFPNNKSQFTTWNNDEVNKLFEASQSETDTKKRADLYAKIQAIYNVSGPVLPLYESPYPVVLKKTVKGFNQIPLGNNIFRAAYIEK